MYNETQLAAIKLFGDKTLSDGCIVGDFESQVGFRYRIISYKEFDCPVNGECEFIRVISLHRKEEIYKFDSRHDDERKNIDTIKSQILGHEPHLFPDVARVAEEQGKRIDIHYFTEGFHISFQPLNKTMNNPKYIPYDYSIPLLSQPNLSEIVNLFSK